MARLAALWGLVGLALWPAIAESYQTDIELVPGRPALPVFLPHGVDAGDVAIDVLEVDTAGTVSPSSRPFLSIEGIRVESRRPVAESPFWLRPLNIHGRAALLMGARARTEEGRVERVRVRLTAGERAPRGMPLPEGWPLVVAEPEPTLVIVTTKSIQSSSVALAEYVAWREADGLTVTVGTEDDWDRPFVSRHLGRADAIREWLAGLEATQGVGYVLLVGDPDPEGDGIPMRLTHPLEAILDRLPEEWVWVFDPVPTDHFYSDLTGDWDLDGDGRFAELPDDLGKEGLHWEPDALVGRIPVYDGDVERLDEILVAIMDHERDPSPSARRRVLLPAAFLGFAGQPRTVWGTYDVTDDGAAVLDVIGQTILGLDPTAELVRLYEESGLLPSSFEHERPLERETLLEEWGIGAGIVVASAHGGTDESYRSIWTADLDEDEEADEDEVIREVFISSDDVEALAGGPGAFTFHAACRNGWPEDPNNLGTALLGRGAVATVASSRAAMGSGAGFEPAPELADADTMAFTYVHLLLEGLSAGAALAYLRYGLPGDGWDEPWGGYAWLGKLEYNLYGDPLSSLGRCESNLDCLRGSLCREAGRCVEGYCARGEVIDCSAEDGPCTVGRCDRRTGDCIASPLEDGTLCDDGLFCTVDDHCSDGLCEGAERDCGSDGDASPLSCDEALGECTSISHDAGAEGGPDEPTGGCQGCAVAASRPRSAAWLRLLLWGV